MKVVQILAVLEIMEVVQIIIVAVDADANNEYKMKFKNNVVFGRVVLQKSYKDVRTVMEKKLRFSKFNVVTKVNGLIVVFNSLKNTYSVFENELAELNEGELKFAEKQGILIPNDMDEDKLAEKKYKEKVEEKWLNVTIMPTMGCNFNCSYCYENHQANMMNDKTVSNIIEFIKKYSRDMEGIHISWFGGEPTLCLSIIKRISNEIILYSNMNKKKFIADMTSNGYLLTPELLKKLVACRIIMFQITVDGTREIHNRQRPLVNKGESYDVILNNLIAIRDKAKSRIFKIMIRVNLTHEGYQKLEEIKSSFLEHFEKDDRFVFLYRKVGDWGGERVKKIKENLLDSEDNLNTNLAESGESVKAFSQTTEFASSYGVCYAGKKHAYVINPEGNVLKCTVNLSDPGNMIGKIGDKGEIICNENEKIWNLSFSNRYIPEKCKECPLWANCFNNLCTSSSINGREPSGRACGKLEENLKNVYLLTKSSFKSYEDDQIDGEKEIC